MLSVEEEENDKYKKVENVFSKKCLQIMANDGWRVIHTYPARIMREQGLTFAIKYQCKSGNKGTYLQEFTIGNTDEWCRKAHVQKPQRAPYTVENYCIATLINHKDEDLPSFIEYGPKNMHDWDRYIDDEITELDTAWLNLIADLKSEYCTPAYKNK